MKKTNAALLKAVTKRHEKLAKALAKEGIPCTTHGGEITSINAKALYSPSRIDAVQVDASRVAVECSVGINDLFCENYHMPVEAIKSAFLNGRFGGDETPIVQDGEHLRMTFESLDAKEVIEHLQDFLEELEDRHEMAVDKLLDEHPVFGINQLC